MCACMCVCVGRGEMFCCHYRCPSWCHSLASESFRPFLHGCDSTLSQRDDDARALVKCWVPSWLARSQRRDGSDRSPHASWDHDRHHGGARGVQGA